MHRPHNNGLKLADHTHPTIHRSFESTMETYSSSRFAWVVALAMAMGAVAVMPCAAQNTAKVFVDLHNAARAEVGVDPVRWQPTIATWAQNYTNQYWGTCANGENIATGPTGTDMSASAVVAKWIAEKQYYNNSTNSCAKGHMCHHYTQVVSRETKVIGCATVGCKSGGTFVICKYYQANNWASQSQI